MYSSRFLLCWGFDVWKKIIGIVGAVLAVVLGLLFNARGKSAGQRLDANKRDIGKSLDRTESAIGRQGQAIDRQGSAIDRAIELAGSNQERELDDQKRKRESEQREADDAKLVADSRAIRARAEELLNRD